MVSISFKTSLTKVQMLVFRCIGGKFFKSSKRVLTFLKSWVRAHFKGSSIKASVCILLCRTLKRRFLANNIMSLVIVNLSILDGGQKVNPKSRTSLCALVRRCEDKLMTVDA